MHALIEVLAAGQAVTLQDRGRFGYRHIGVPVSGALDPYLMSAANALLANDANAAVLEVCLGGPTLLALSGPVRIALAGELSGKLLKAQGGTRQLQPWQTATLFPGDIAHLGNVAHGIAYVGIAGGFQVAPQLGSRSTCLSASLGGVDGRALMRGDRLPCARLHGDPSLESAATLPWPQDSGPIRVLPGPQDDHFTAQARQSFFAQPYRVTPDLDRMGIRLDGASLTHAERRAEIVSDGVAPGAVQVPANGQPIVLMADCQTTGGYAKIATVIRADLARLAHVRPGDELRFVAVDHAQAAAALLQRKMRVGRWYASLASFRPPGTVDALALQTGNLISGAIRGDEAGGWTN